MTHAESAHDAGSNAHDLAIHDLYHQLLQCWNRRDADAFAALFADDANLIGFDGSQINGHMEIASSLRQIFGAHQTGAYVGKVREIRWLAAEVALLRAVCGMIGPGQTELNPALNAVQTLIASRQAEQWQITLFHNTPAQLHGRPELVAELTAELREELRRQAANDSR